MRTTPLLHSSGRKVGNPVVMVTPPVGLLHVHSLEYIRMFGFCNDLYRHGDNCIHSYYDILTINLTSLLR